ncbi:unnamed protein product [Clonostachys rosea f. rosea IK726]|uniref:Uncharacterized protein n=2 Tax=Bionectria ochroleuca TaxID=29856 RepID=A0A0B7JY97_BIOOC|nr:unnamed protein product [Clonostachys rosea f. rosea IK726]
MTTTLTSRRRNLIVAFALVFLTTVLFLSSPLLNLKYKTTSHTPHPTEDPQQTPEPTPEKPAKPPQPEAPVSRLHYLIPASGPNLNFCLNLASSAAARYPVPSILGFHGEGILDAAATHLAKLRVIQRYLDSLPKEEDNDLVLIVDGYDIIQQLPPVIMIERYFDEIHQANGRIARRFGITVAEAREKGLYNTILWGPDKACFPYDENAPRCWAVPPSHLPPDIFGPNTGGGEMEMNDPIWLNSGTVIGPVNDMRLAISATLREIDATYDENFDLKESDQYYVANVWARQEYYRSKQAVHGEEVKGGPPTRWIPTAREGDPQVEYHMGLDYESSLFQAKAFNEPYYGYLQFNSSGLNANMNVDINKQGAKFVPYLIEMPANVLSALGDLFESIGKAHAGTTLNDWIRSVDLGVNYVTGHIFPLWHCTGEKNDIELTYTKMWFFPYARSLISATVKAFQGDDLISTHLIDGRKWAPKNRYPDANTLNDTLGGAWTDLQGSEFVQWEQLCGEHSEALFRGEDTPL